MMNSGSGMFAIYDCAEHAFACSGELKRHFSIRQSPAEVMSPSEWQRMDGVLWAMSHVSAPTFQSEAFLMKDASGETVCCKVGFMTEQPGKHITLTFLVDHSGKPWDGKTERRRSGILNRKSFLSRLNEVLQITPSAGSVVYFDVQRFKVINSVFGTVEGDRLLDFISGELLSMLSGTGFACRTNADRFLFYTLAGKGEVEKQIDALFDKLASYGLPFEILCNAGVYLMDGVCMTPTTIIDCAMIAQTPVKGSYTNRYHFYTPALHSNLLTEQEITGAMRQALENHLFQVYFQPQYNHSTKELVGAEALVRWIHPEKGTLSPSLFIPVFESNGFISQLDQYVFTCVCAFQRRMMELSLPCVPISVNLTRYDLVVPGFLDRLERIRQSYNVPAQYIRIEMTESSALGGSHLLNEALTVLHGYGYTVEMDDFGAGYSSLNILKDTHFDVIKLDMRFFEREKGENAGRGGIILSSVVRMIHWLKLPMIAEGVETLDQADFLRSIGCDYIQGFLYSRPVPESEFAELLRKGQAGEAVPDLSLTFPVNLDGLWSSDSLETLIFSNFAGGAAIFACTRHGQIELLRINRQYLQELGVPLSEKELLRQELLSMLEPSSRPLLLAALERAIDTGEQQTCETWRTLSCECGEQKRVCIRTTLRIIARSKETFLCYAQICNITNEKQAPVPSAE